MREFRVKCKIVSDDVAKEVDGSDEVEPREEIHVSINDDFLTRVVDGSCGSIFRVLDECDCDDP